ncbi:hypothetical protein [Nocardia sp. NPDC051832]|uniref:hypothetical protein n=1 Tax=Nocardia sp. NPDC051832 TaxID=3155673 RepID=UPI003441FE86
MSGQQVEIHPEKLRQSSGTMSGVAEELRAAQQAAADAIAKIKSAAGNDKFGDQFRFGSAGEPGFDEYSATLVDSTSIMAENLDEVSVGLNDSADAMDEVESANTEVLSTDGLAGGGGGGGSAGGGAPATSAAPLPEIPEQSPDTSDPAPAESTVESWSAADPLGTGSVGLDGLTGGPGLLEGLGLTGLTTQSAAEQADAGPVLAGGLDALTSGVEAVGTGIGELLEIPAETESPTDTAPE